MRKPRIYISGKVSGTDSIKCAAKFERAERKLKRDGFIAINPLDVVNDPKCHWQKAMRMCITAMMSADAVILLHDWKKSRGAFLERMVAKELDIPAFNHCDDLLKYFGKYDPRHCSHNRRRTVVVESLAGCETTQTRCEDCGANLDIPITEC